MSAHARIRRSRRRFTRSHGELRLARRRYVYLVWTLLKPRRLTRGFIEKVAKRMRELGLYADTTFLRDIERSVIYRFMEIDGARRWGSRYDPYDPFGARDRWYLKMGLAWWAPWLRERQGKRQRKAS